MKNIPTLLSFITLSLLTWSCYNNTSEDKTVVLLEDLMYLGTDQVNPLARIYSLSEPLQDHGFEISTSKSFENSSKLSLGPRDTPGLFTTSYDSILQGVEYYYRAYVQTKNNMIYTDASNFHTFKVHADSISIIYGRPDDQLTVYGSNFTKDVKIFFGDKEAEVYSRIEDINIRVIVPPSTARLQPIFAQIDGKKTLIDTFEYITGRWTKLSTSTSAQIYGPIQLRGANSYTYFLGQTNTYNGKNNKIHTLDLNTFTWAEQTMFEGPTITDGSFYTQSGYFGSGADSVFYHPLDDTIEYNLINEFWKYEETGVTRLDSLPIRCQYAVCYEIDGNLYLSGGLGKNNKTPLYQSHSYKNGVWTKLRNLPFSTSSQFPQITHDGKVVFINSKGEFWVYNPLTDKYRLHGYLHSTLLQGSFTLRGSSGQVHFGLDRLGNKVYRLDIETTEEGFYKPTFIPKNDFPGDQRFVNKLTFTIGDKIYIYRCKDTVSPVETELWMFEPNEFPE